VGEPVAADTIAEELEIPKATARRHLNALRERSLVERSGSGKKGDPYLWRLCGMGEAE
jgi:predicted ArsR family transcriptional regulator